MRKMPNLLASTALGLTLLLMPALSIAQSGDMASPGSLSMMPAKGRAAGSGEAHAAAPGSLSVMPAAPPAAGNKAIERAVPGSLSVMPPAPSAASNKAAETVAPGSLSAMPPAPSATGTPAFKPTFWAAYAEGGIGNNSLWPIFFASADRGHDNDAGTPALWASWAASLDRGGSNAYWPCIIAGEVGGSGGADARLRNDQQSLMQAECELSLARRRLARAETTTAEARRQVGDALPSTDLRRQARLFLISAAQDLADANRDLDRMLGETQAAQKPEPLTSATGHTIATTAATASQPAVPAVEVERLIGKPVRNRDGRQLGILDKVIAGQHGRIDKIVIGHGGFFGLFQSRSEIGWQFAKPRIEGGRLILAISPDQVAGAPAYANSKTGH
jgi:PRC-barrel domain